MSATRPFPTMGRPMRRALTALCAILAATLALPACGSDESSPSRSSTTRTPVTLRPPPDLGCTSEFRTKLTVTTDDPREVPYLTQITACTNEFRSATYLDNNSDAAWTLRAVPRATAEQVAGLNAWQEELRRAQSAVSGTEVMAPRSSVVVHARPDNVRWSLAAGHSTSWSVATSLADFVSAKATAGVDELLKSSPRVKAIVTCGIATNAIVGADFQRITTGDPVEAVLKGLGLFGAATACANDWLVADRAALRKSATTAQWTEVQTLTRKIAFTSQLGDDVGALKKAIGLLIAFRRA